MTGKGSSGGKGSATKKQTPPSTGSKGKQQVISGFFAKKLPDSSATEDASTPKGSAAPAASTPGPKTASPKHNGTNTSSPGTRKSPSGKSPGGSAKKSARAAGPGEELLGTRITVWWPLDEAWYKGTVKQWDGKQGKHQVAYDDGEVEWVTLGTEKWRTLSGEEATPDGAGAQRKGAPGKRGGRLSQQGKPTKQRRVVMSDDEDEDMEESASQDDSGSEFDAGGEVADDSGEEGLEDVESEGCHEGPDGSDADAGPKKKRGKQSGSKRKQPANGKGPASKKRASPTHTPSTPANPPGHGAGLLKAPGSAGPPSSGTADINNKAIGSTGSMQQGGSSGGSWQHLTPQAGARKVLHSKLDVRTSPGTQGTAKEPQVVHGVATRLSNEDTCRFQETMALNYPFLHPSRIMDAKKRRPDHPDYDPRTLYLPPNFFKENKVSPGQQQWWEIKAANFDSVLLFKQGKFYEMFEMDSYVGVDVLGLTFMKGEKPHAGFPEVRYHDMAEGLARAGYRVVGGLFKSSNKCSMLFGLTSIYGFSC
ncbi:hypothetical protein DUNSADRAFT_3078 [Dunaliella salina]|uniref:DNA mismatch repair protein MutS-like N-terminal domain-containing protein n=1 Tax=Dunaliella salina TaxID=3046 RepID=A0ABQ7GUJ5_DUNSA|nr:hypothetical protein DUNSADRAFT_3078 [Dunaliella salina]|eukprot:KAF5838282.1 hypothetical protein DUNSADRAFT_3078 [Dunaliella salina]